MTYFKRPTSPQLFCFTGFARSLPSGLGKVLGDAGCVAGLPLAALPVVSVPLRGLLLS